MNPLALIRHARDTARDYEREAARQRLACSAAHGADHPFSSRDFRLYWVGVAASALGDAFVFVALPFLVLEVSGSSTALATTVMLGALPRFVGPLIGAFADRWPLRRPLVATGLLRFLLFGILGLLAVRGQLSLPLIYLAAPLNGLLTIFVFSAGNVLVPHLVPRARLGQANSLMQAAVMGVPLLGLGVAGALVAAVGPGLNVALSAPFFAVLVVVSSRMRFPERAAGEGSPNLFSDVVQGAALLFRSGPLAFLLLASLALNAALSLLNVAMPVLMERLGKGAAGYGLFQTALSVGMLTGILAVNAAHRLKPQYGVGLAQGVMALGFAVLAGGSFAWFLGGGVVLGFGLGFTEVAAVTLLQLAVPDGMRGKVLGLVLSTNALGLMGGAWLSGRLVEGVDASVLFTVSAGVVLVMGMVWTALNLSNREWLQKRMETRTTAQDALG
jgi:MFS family permease